MTGSLKPQKTCRPFIDSRDSDSCQHDSSPPTASVRRFWRASNRPLTSVRYRSLRLPPSVPSQGDTLDRELEGIDNGFALTERKNGVLNRFF